MNQYTSLPRVGCLESLALAFKKFGTINGRSRRSEFWYFFILIRFIDLILLIISLATATIETKTIYNYPYYYQYQQLKINPVLEIINGIFFLSYCYPIFV